MAASEAPYAASPVPRPATPRDLVTPFTTACDDSAAANGSLAFGNIPMGHCYRATPRGAYRCPECAFIAPSYELLTGHHNVWHRTSGLAEL
ncbi:hypothetical protein AAVH_16843 [Aphelenchoides avenae]|nr:hypothetical protein AAVH_16843 [Aphelenchus avenae]